MLRKLAIPGVMATPSLIGLLALLVLGGDRELPTRPAGRPP